MNTSPATQFLSEIGGTGPIPETKLAYLEQRVLNNFYAFVVGKFLSEKEKSNLTQAKLARRINRGTDVVNRWLASPSNWQISTLARLLIGITGEEAVLSSFPLLGRAPRNQTVLDLLDDETDDRRAQTTKALEEVLGPTRIVLPIPPTTNHLRMPAGGRLITSPEYRAWQAEAGVVLIQQRPKPIEGRVSVSIEVACADKRRRDLDNTCNFKAVLDLLVKHRIIDGDDNRTVRYIEAHWDDIGDTKRLVVTIKRAVF